MFTKTFNDIGTFQALYAAQNWLEENGYSYGSSCVMRPIPVLKGEFVIAKWKNLTKAEVAALDGSIDGDLRNGPITVYLKQSPVTRPLATDTPAHQRQARSDPLPG